MSDSTFRFKLDNNSIIDSAFQEKKYPFNWLPPQTIKWQGDMIPYKYFRGGVRYINIKSISKGIHTFEATYEADAGEWFEDYNEPMVRTFVYILKPTDKWKSFNNLNLKVFIPSRWDYSSNLELRDSLGVFVGNWKTLPERYFSISLTKPAFWGYFYTYSIQIFIYIGYILFVVGIIYMIYKIKLAEPFKSIIIALTSTFFSILNLIVILLIADTNYIILKYFLDNSISPIDDSGYPKNFIFIIFILFFGFIVFMFYLNSLFKKRTTS
jgi:hypothetical protein